jgi:hypothetical protein
MSKKKRIADIVRHCQLPESGLDALDVFVADGLDTEWTAIAGWEV